MDDRQHAFLARQPSAALQPPEHFWGMPKRGLAFLLANVMFWQPLWAQADGIVVSAPGTRLGQAGNGVPIVNIAKPNGSGLSHNQFKDYNVGSNGVILNNATNVTQATQLGGIILGNPNLKGAGAKIILNEVNGGNPSQLRGYTEVAGQSAHVIVANPYGISCNGCGFINTPKATLTTGKPIIENGQLSRYQVDQGSVAIEGAGLNANNVDRFEIITRSAKINAEIQAKNLTIIAGRNDVNANTLNATARADDGSTKPQLAIDSSALGGMYAGAIKLVGTEAGVGVKLDGKMVASGGDIQLDANGHLSMAETAATGAVDIQAKSVETRGQVYAGSRLDVKTPGDLTSQNNLVARDSIRLDSGGTLSNNGIIEAGVNADNSRNTAGDVTLTAKQLNNGGRTVIASRDLNVTTTAALNNQGGTLSGQRKTTVTGNMVDNRNKGRLLGGTELHLNADQVLNSQGGLINSQGLLTANLGHLENNAGELSSLNSATLILGSLDNLTGLVMAGKNLDITNTGAIKNQGGELSSQGVMTVRTASLDNRSKGTVAANGKLVVTATGKVNNADQGLIASRSAGVELEASSLDNAKGTLQGKGLVTVDVSGDIDNQGGTIIAQDADLNIEAANLDNRGGVLSSVKAALEARTTGVLRNGYDLDGQGGTIQAQGLNIQALAGLFNDGGRMAAQAGDIVITNAGADIDNRSGGMYATGKVKVIGRDIDNSGGGQVSANRIDFDLSGALNNNAGIIESQDSLDILAASLSNQKGQLRTLGQNSTTVFNIGGLFDNNDGTLETASQNVGLDTNSLQNVGGKLLHTGLGVFGISQANLGQAGGQLVTYGNLTVTADRWTNSTAIQAGHLVVDVDQMTQTATGQLLSTDSLVGRGSNWHVDGLIGSDGTIDLQLTGAYTGNGRLSSLGTLGLKAALINLEQNGSIAGAGNTTVVVDGVLNSYGRLTSAADMSVTAATINNYGTLGSAGALGVSTGDLLNERGLIFSAGNTSLRVDSLTNRYADIYSLGNLSIDRDGLGTHASRILNSSGSLQSDGSMRLAASTIDNVREILTTNDAGIYTASIRGVACIAGVNAGDCRGGKQNQVWQIIQRDKFEVTAASAASSITTGGNLDIQGGALTNQSSSIGAAGALTANLVSLNNIGLETGEIETSRTFMSARTRSPGSRRDAANTFTNKYWIQSPTYDPNDLSGLEAAMSRFIGRTERELPQFRTQIATTDNQTYAAIIQAGGAINIPTQGDVNSGVVRGGYNYVGAGPRTDTQADNAFSTRISVNRQLPPNLIQQQVDPLALPGFDLPTGQNGLFRMSGDGSTTPTQSTGLTQVRGLPDRSFQANPQKYLIETNPALTDMRRFMSSDYLLTNLGYDPDTAAKRLGDGFYEQRLIQQAVIARTGQRFLDGQNSDDGMFKYLMNNAIASKDSLNLSLGVSLTAEQVAALTHDIVWMENRTVNNQQVLVPVLYLAQANNRLAPNGALIQGSDVSLIAGRNLNNAGTLRASSNLRATAGDSLVNSGLLEAGNRLEALAGNDLTNRAGGVIAGRDVSVVAVTGDLTNERTITRHASSTGYKTEQRDFADSAARIEASHDLSAGAGRDIANVGGVLKSGNDTTLRAARNMNITAAEQVDSHTQGSKHRDQTITQNGSSVTVGRDLQAAAGGDLKVVASQVEAKRNLAIVATKNLTLGPAANEQHSYGQSKKVKSIEDHVQQVSTTLKAGGDATLSAGQDLTLVASTVNAGNEAYLVAGNNLALRAAADQDYSFYSKTKKSSSGKKFRLDETDSTTQVGSLVSSGGNSTLVAGENLLLAGSAVTAEKGATKLVAGKDVQIFAVTDSDSARHERKESKSSWGGFKSSKVQDKVDEKRTTAVGSMVSGETVTVAGGQDVKVTGSSLVSTGDLAVQAGRDLTIDAAQNTFSRTDMHKEKNRDLTGVLTGNKLGLDDMTGNQHLFINSQKHNGTATETTLTGSTVGSSSGNVTLTAGRELSVVASDLVSTKDMSLNGANVTIAAGTETADQISKDNSRSLAVGRVVGGIVVDTVKSIRNDVRAAQQADDSRLKAVKAAQALLSAYNAMRGDDSAANESDGRPANSKGSFIKIGTELASTRKKSTSEYHAETVKQSTLNSGGSLAIVATGNAPDTKGDIHIVGSSLKANDTLLQAKNNITLESAQDRRNWDNQNTTNKTSIGASFNIGEQMGFTLDLGARMAKGMGTGREVTQVNSTVDTGLLVLKSGQDTTLAGAQVRADAIKADIGGNLNIASRQDEASQKNKQTSGGVGVSICVPPFCLGAMVSGSAEFAGSKMNSDYKAVAQQTGFFAGSGGYDINVGKNTTLQGAVIASEASVDKNHLSTGRLLVSDIKNKSDIKSQAAGLSYSGATAGFDDARSGVGGSIPLMLKESDSSKTRSAVSLGTIVVRDAAGANDLEGLSRDTANANAHLDRPDEKAMQERIDLIQSSAQLSGTVISMVGKAKADAANKQAKAAVTPEEKQAAAVALADASSWQVGGDKRLMADITSGLIAAGLGGATGSTAVGIVANTSSSDIFNKIGSFADAQKNRKGIDDATRAAWAEGGAARVLLHALAGAAIGLSSGNAQSGALGVGASAALMPSISNALSGSSLNEKEQNALATLIAMSLGAALGTGSGVSGSVVAGSGAASVDLNNRQLHIVEVNRIKALAGKFAEDQKISVQEAEARLLAQAQQSVDKDFATDHAMVDLGAVVFLRSQAETFVDENGRVMLMFAPSGKDAYENAGMYGHTWSQFTNEQRAMLSAASSKTQSQKESEIWDATRNTALAGLGKGVVNYPSDSINGIIDLGKQLFHVDGVGNEVVGVPLDYRNETEQEIAKGTQNLISNAMATLGAAWTSTRKGVNTVERETETYFRVEGGGSGKKTSQNRISVNEDGSVTIDSGCSGQLCVSTNGPNHASYYLANRRADGDVVVFEVDAALHKEIMASAIQQKPMPNVPRDPNAPKIVDPGKGEPSISLELPKVWDRLIEQSSSKARVLTSKEFVDEFGK
ncbi:hemagglutinin repeat-containing protein [Pseudomonas hefeiensis]|uniref:Hemagglutinin repeat-containing protein n=1 Tax=Pseudomonas hefeiensis TaxID=2738125 RepID=A0ABY9GEG2_9PSED|nr:MULTISPECIES: hemagglutinin repeat-containing protein [unclassified Pseudomonas]WLH14025.1 hemagglutinin repeat-containing protein [Pseudomonas sp. FP205]WLH97079.1 hemagglutinin repeat-containing protein [Pseudomonas sp. FP53]WLI41355.1 hemagglutinin repeat-containing protein [Pseudomonas sp. FP821]